MINETEQWITGGDCNKCRKNNYCSKECKEHVLYINNLIISTACDKSEAFRLAYNFVTNQGGLHHE